MTTTTLKPITPSGSLIPFRIFNQPDEEPRKFAKDLIANGWMIVATPRMNMVALVDWCRENLDHGDFGYSIGVSALIFSSAAVAIQFKLACL